MALDKMEKSNKLKNLFIITTVILTLIAGLRPIGLDNDSLSYVSVLHLNIFNADYSSKEPFFWIINDISKLLFLVTHEQAFFLIFAFLGVSIKLLAIQSLSLSPRFAIIVYIFMYFILHEMTQIRTGIASAIFLLSIPDIHERNLRKFSLKIIIATMFHYSSFPIMLAAYILTSKKINISYYFLLPIAGILFATLDIDINTIKNILESFEFSNVFMQKTLLYVNLLEEEKFNEINVFNFFYIGLFLLFYAVLFNIKRLKGAYDKTILKIFSLMLFSFYFFSSIPVLSFRISEFLGVVLIILIPHFAIIFKKKIIPYASFLVLLATYFQLIMLSRNLNF